MYFTDLHVMVVVVLVCGVLPNLYGGGNGFGARVVGGQPYNQYATTLAYDGGGDLQTNVYDRDAVNMFGEVTLPTATNTQNIPGTGMPWATEVILAGNGGVSYGLKITNATALAGQVLVFYGYCWGVASKSAPVDTTFLDVVYFKHVGTNTGVSVQPLPYNFKSEVSIPGKMIGIVRSSDVPSGFENNDRIGIVVVQNVSSGSAQDYTLSPVNGISQFPAGVWWGVSSRYVQVPGTETLTRTYSENHKYQGIVAIQMTQSYLETGTLNMVSGFTESARTTFEDLASSARPWVVQTPLNANSSQTNVFVVEVVFQSSVTALNNQYVEVDVCISGFEDPQVVNSVTMQVVLMDSSDTEIVGQSSPRITYYTYRNEYIFMNNRMTFAKSALLATRKIRFMFNTGLTSKSFWRLSDAEVNLQITSTAYAVA